MFISQILIAILNLVAPNAPGWVGSLISLVIPAVFEVVDELSTTDLRGKEKFELAVVEVAEAMDDAFDSIPEWSALTEDQRDRIIGGLVELAVFISNLTDKVGKRGSRRAIRKSIRVFKREVADA